jgi:hypothetical protein
MVDDFDVIACGIQDLRGVIALLTTLGGGAGIIALDGTPPPKNEPDSDELLTVEQVAETLKVIPDT